MAEEQGIPDTRKSPPKEGILSLDSYGVDNHLFVNKENYRRITEGLLTLQYPSDLWRELVAYAVPFFDGRPGFEHHTWAVTYWACQLAIRGTDREKLNPLVVVTVAMLHDVGYAVKEQVTSPDMLFGNEKERHIVNGLEITNKFLAFDNVTATLTEEEREQILLVIKTHDDEQPPQDINTAVFVAADSLGAIDLTFGRLSFTKLNAYQWWTKSARRRLGLMDKIGGELFVFARNEYVRLSDQLLDYLAEGPDGVDKLKHTA